MRGVNVLVVEDDAQLAELLARVFRDEGHVPTVCTSLRSAEDAAMRSHFDVAVVDRMLPDGDGLRLCGRLRRHHVGLPILILTARGYVADRVIGLREGADDYLTKPFEVEELLARVDAIRRRAAHSWCTRVGALEIDRRVQVVRAAGTRLDLTAREYAFLSRLADGHGECVTRLALLEDVWNLRSDGSGVVDVLVSRLRDKLGELAWMVETVRGQGFRLRGVP